MESLLQVAMGSIESWVFISDKEGINHVPHSHEFEKGPNILFILCQYQVLVTLRLLCDLIITIVSSWYFNTSLWMTTFQVGLFKVSYWSKKPTSMLKCVQIIILKSIRLGLEQKITRIQSLRRQRRTIHCSLPLSCPAGHAITYQVGLDRQHHVQSVEPIAVERSASACSRFL